MKSLSEKAKPMHERDILEHLAAKVNAPAAQDRNCTWTHEVHHESDAWDTQCGNAFLLVEGTPAENDMAFCPYCGGHLVTEPV